MKISALAREISNIHTSEMISEIHFLEARCRGAHLSPLFGVSAQKIIEMRESYSGDTTTHAVYSRSVASYGYNSIISPRLSRSSALVQSGRPRTRAVRWRCVCVTFVVVCTTVLGLNIYFAHLLYTGLEATDLSEREDLLGDHGEKLLGDLTDLEIPSSADFDLDKSVAQTEALLPEVIAQAVDIQCSFALLCLVPVSGKRRPAGGSKRGVFLLEAVLY